MAEGRFEDAEGDALLVDGAAQREKESVVAGDDSDVIKKFNK